MAIIVFLVMDRSLYYNNSGFDLLQERSVSKKMATALEFDLESSVSTALFNHHIFVEHPAPSHIDITYNGTECRTSKCQSHLPKIHVSSLPRASHHQPTSSPTSGLQRLTTGSESTKEVPHQRFQTTVRPRMTCINPIRISNRLGRGNGRARFAKGSRVVAAVMLKWMLMLKYLI